MARRHLRLLTRIRTYVDFAWLPWNALITSPATPFKAKIYDHHDYEKNYPNFVAWHNRLMARESVSKIYAGMNH